MPIPQYGIIDFVVSPLQRPDEKKAVKSIIIYNGFSLYNLTLDGFITAKQNRFLYLVNC